MSLRSRLTTAFLVVVLGPVLVGAVFVAAVMSQLSDSRGEALANSAVTMVDSTLGTICERIQASAAAVALNYSNSSGSEADAVEMAALLVDRSVIDGVVFSSIDTAGAEAAPRADVGVEAPDGAWVDCGETAAYAGAGPIEALGAQAEVQAADGSTAVFSAFRVVDVEFLGRIARVADAELVLQDSRTDPLEAGAVDAGRWDFTDAFLPLSIGTTATDVTPMYWTLAAMVTASAVCAMGLAAWLARSTTRPLAELSAAAERVSEGDLDVRVPAHGRDEVAHLAFAFNRMTAQTQAYVQALTASRDQMRGQLGRLGQTLTATLDLDRILEVILDTAMVTAGAEAGVVMLVDVDDADQLRQRAGEGDLGIDQPASIRIGQGIIGAIAASGAPAHGRITGGALGDWHRADTEPDARTIVAVPFSGRQPVDQDFIAGRQPSEPDLGAAPQPGGVLGVLVLYNRVAGEAFESGDVDTLRTFAGQASVAVENVLLHRQAQRLSLTDPLTGLWNYRFMQTSLRREAERTRRYQRPSALLAIDLDRFKAVNDAYGHPVGDQVLIELARRITAQIREVDLAFRHGGEEFMVLLPETDAAGAEVVAERLGRAVACRPFKVNESSGGRELRVSVSIGVAVLGVHADSATAVLAAADEALYAAKAAGRGTWRTAPV
ncbi:diguanylate cyclase [Glycomyces harbinensis]|uniref:Diguanylate cyclase (GGDEF) domain-containing protein n=1 Tax=Glycomyces harbinensis TaxID=58114 RepID=A0A1G6Z645_9ACTN|nr:diguanylate cyclase [Glycomyces harbinensis]SDD98001.1 diguanylate cyclase (GGDEF) domain-containing protein [Glycomyces harbinensis]